MFLAHLLVGIIAGLTASAVALVAGTSFLGASAVYALAGCIGTVASAGLAAVARFYRASASGTGDVRGRIRPQLRCANIAPKFFVTAQGSGACRRPFSTD